MGKLCIGMDFRALNSNMRLDVFFLPCIANLLDRPGRVIMTRRFNLAYMY